MSWLASFVAVVGTQEPERPPTPEPLPQTVHCFEELVAHRRAAEAERVAALVTNRGQEWATTVSALHACVPRSPDARAACLAEAEQFVYARLVTDEAFPPKRVTVDTTCGPRAGIEAGGQYTGLAPVLSRLALAAIVQELHGPAERAVPSATFDRLVQLRDDLAQPVPRGAGLSSVDYRELTETINTMWTLSRGLEVAGHGDDARQARQIVGEGLVLYAGAIARLEGASWSPSAFQRHGTLPTARSAQLVLRRAATLSVRTLHEAVATGGFDHHTEAALAALARLEGAIGARGMSLVLPWADLDDIGLEHTLAAWGQRDQNRSKAALDSALQHNLFTDPVEAELASAAVDLEPVHVRSAGGPEVALHRLDALARQHPHDFRVVAAAVHAHARFGADHTPPLHAWVQAHPRPGYAEAVSRIWLGSFDEDAPTAALRAVVRAGVAGRLPPDPQ